jgi:hypothetical protein
MDQGKKFYFFISPGETLPPPQFKRWKLRRKFQRVTLAGLGLGLIFLLNLICLSFGVNAARADDTPPGDRTRFFSKTGYSVHGLFLDYWEAHGGEAAFGNPLTQEFEETEPQTGVVRLKQWFERARFELHPEFGGTPNQIQLGALGREALAAQPKRLVIEPAFQAIAAPAPAPDAAAKADVQFFKETGHTLRGRFKAFWEAYGGLTQFGYPLSEELKEFNPASAQLQTVQWFERARFELHPEFAGTRYEVELWPLGWQMFWGGPAPEQWQGAGAALTLPSGPLSNPNGLDNNGGPGPGGSTTPGNGPGNNNGAGGNSSSSSNNNSSSSHQLGYGMNVWLFGQDKARVLGLVSAAGFNWIRQQVGWDGVEPTEGHFEWTELDQIVETARARQLKLILSVVRSPRWAGLNSSSGLPADVRNCGELMRQMASRYKGKVAAYEVWNEENLGYEIGGMVSAAHHVEMLKAAYPAVKGQDSAALVLFGGLSPTGLDDPRYAVDDAKFLDECYQYNGGKIKGYFDVLGAHAGSAANSPDEFWSNDPTSPDLVRLTSRATGPPAAVSS